MRIVSAILGVVLLARLAAAQEATARLTADSIYTDEAAEVRVVFGDAEVSIEKLVLTVPEGFRAEGPFGGMRRISMMNGERTSSLEFGFRVVPPPTAEGSFTIGPIVAEIAGKPALTVPVGTLAVGRRPAAAVLFTAEAAPPGGPVGAPFLLRYKILYSGELFLDEDGFGQVRNPSGLTRLSLPILADRRVRVEEGAAAPGATALRIDENTTIHVVEGSEKTPGGLFRTLSFTFKVTPLEAAEIPLAGEAGLAIVSGKERQQDFFGRVRIVPVGREQRAAAANVVYRVEPLPEAGRPTGFNGAVGRYAIAADAAPREVNAFDPVTVTVKVPGDGLLDRLALPRFSDFPEIARDFEVDPDTDPGKVEGGAKTFKVVLRPRSAAVTALPPLPFPYYDPLARRYETARSAAIPLVVHEVRTVRPEESVGPAVPAAGGAPAGPILPLTAVAANYDALSGGSGRLAPQAPLLTPGFLALLAAPPIAAAAAFLLAAARSRRRGAPRGTPLARALSGVRDVGSPEEAATAFARYFAEKLHLPGGELTTAELKTALAARLVDEKVAERVAKVHEEIVAARFAGGGRAPSGWADALREVDRCLP